MKLKYILLFALLVSTRLVQAAAPDEGMWIPMLINKNYEEMKRLGIKLTAKDIYDVNNSSLKDAIVWFNGGCTAEVVSKEGLLLTNHHCGYDAIADHSTAADNILDNGFWAKTKEDEKVNPGMWVSILVRMEDVTEEISAALKGLDEKARAAKLAELNKALVKKANEDGKYDSRVTEFYKGNAYYLFVFEKFTDIRLVGTPPQSIGKFGGDTDNWMWPRHTGDFSMFRIYANKDNKPAPYAKDNVPYKPKHSLPISLNGVKEGDFSMVFGFPGRTNRYETSYGIKLAIEKINPTIVALRNERLKLWKEEMDKSDSVRLLLSSNYASVANYWKYFIGQTEQLKRLKIYDYKVQQEKAFNKWATGMPEYTNALVNIEKAYATYVPYAMQRTYLNEGVFGSAMAAHAFAYNQLEKTLTAEKPDPEAKKQQVDALKAGVEEFFKSFNKPSDEKILAITLQMFYENIPTDQHPALLAEIVKKYKGKTNKEIFEKYAKDVFAKSFMVSKEKNDAFLANPDLKKLQADPGYKYVTAFYNNYITKYKPIVDEFNANNNKEGRAYIKGIMEMNPSKMIYPDANSTLRLTYGTVQDYSPKDAVKFSYVTTLEGIMEKEVPGDYEFDVPARLKDLYKKRDFGQFADAKGEMPVAFITNNDITGGNSGSPVINGEGQLIGLAFDGNWEAMSGDIVFDTKYKRCINVDIRYVLFLIEKYGNAPHIVKEMNLVKK